MPLPGHILKLGRAAWFWPWALPAMGGIVGDTQGGMCKPCSLDLSGGGGSF